MSPVGCAKAFLRGMTRVADLGANSHRAERAVVMNRSDQSALAADWQRVGQDMRKAVTMFGADHGQAATQPSGK